MRVDDIPQYIKVVVDKVEEPFWQQIASGVLVGIIVGTIFLIIQKVIEWRKNP